MNTQMPGGGTPGGGMPGAPGEGTPGGMPPGGMPPGGTPPGGTPPGGMPPGMPVQDKASGMAIASLILSILGLLCGITAIAGIILGIIEMSRIKKGESSPKGRGLALAGIIVGAAVLALGFLLTVLSIATGGFTWEIST